ncbi:hypothetical protein PoMZ_08146 [Pyricularia oryzae]|uniref:C2H2-type domain-containing protein n=1 Tax=Pyricularia oryzae TaxID=318829 RepID=A0A4V1C6V4_PYROR|nr:hypothetical protein PoMZ_08146 [Pyricularia oryzae]
MSQSTNNASVKTSFELALDKFRAQLSDQERVKFAVTKKGDLQVAILNIQNEQRLSKKMVNMRRAQGFIEAMEQFGKVIEVFVNSSEILAFVWGPMKFLLLSAKSWTDSTNELLDTYQHIADSLPIFEGYQDLFKEDGIMQETLKHVWEVILDFHLEALAHLRQRMAKKILHAVWKDFKSRFQPKLDDLNRLKKLIDRHARQLQMRRYEADRASTETHWAKLFAELAQNRKASSEDKKYQRLRRCREIQSWINPPAAIEDHEEQLRVREDLQKATNKQTGRWILENKEVRSWLGPDVPRSSIVWVHGVHGAGKSVLASVIIEELREQKPAPVAFMYCKYRDPQRNSMLDILRAILSQLLNAHQSDPNLPDLSPYYYDEGLAKDGVLLKSVKLCKSLVKLILRNIPKAYIVLDGLDECDSNQRKQILEFMIETIKSCDGQQPGSLRLLIFSRNEPDIKRHLGAETQISIMPENVESDIGIYVTYQSHLIKEQHDLEDYDRTMDRIADPKSEKRKTALKILRMLLCSRRALKWHEIQAAVSMDIDTHTLDHDRRLSLHVQEICGSLVVVLPGDRIEFHDEIDIQPCSSHLINSSYMSSLSAEYEMSLVCLQYLTFDCNFDSEYRPELEEVEGQTAFQDYAAAHWADHVLKMIEVADRAPGTDEPSIPSEDMAHAIGDFGEIYRIDLVVGRDVSPPSPRALSRLGLPASFDIIWRIAQHVDSLRGTGDPDDAVHPSTLARAVTRSRAALESRVLQSDQDEKRILAKYHGENSFKCWRRTCYHFHEGFGLKEEREHHLNRHKKPFECTEPDCDFRLYGFASMPELKKHRRNHHPDNFSTSFPRPPKKTKPRKVAELKFKCEFEGCTAAFSRSSVLRSHAQLHALNSHGGHKIVAMPQTQETFQGRGLEEVVKVVCLFEAWGVGYRT